MSGTTLGVLIIGVSAIAIGAVAIAITKATINEISNTYEGILENRRREHKKVVDQNKELSERIAELEARLTLDRVNEPQQEFFNVPRGRK